MLTKQQKNTLIEQIDKKLGDSKVAIFAEFKGVRVENFKRLRRELKKVNADLKVIKKRLLGIVLKKFGIPFDPMVMKEQISVIFTKDELSNIAPVIHKFVKEVAKAKGGDFAVLGVYDFNEKRFVDSNEFKVIATLPPREVLLAQIAMMLTMPIKQMMNILEQKSKQA